jgi:ankyrin repeat protein
MHTHTHTRAHTHTHTRAHTHARTHTYTQTKSGATAVFVAGEKGHGQSLRSLIRGGADVNVPNNRGVTPLQISAKHGHAEVCRTLLLDGGADVHQARLNGITALSVAVHAGHSDVVSVLLTTGGARLNAVSILKNQLTPKEPINTLTTGGARLNAVSLHRIIHIHIVQINSKSVCGATHIHTEK